MKILRSQEGNITQEIEVLKQGMSIFADTVTEVMEAKTKAVFGEPLSPAESVKRIINDIKEKGDAALEYYSKQFEGVSLSAKDFRIKESEIEDAYKRCLRIYKRHKECEGKYPGISGVAFACVSPGPFCSSGTRITLKYEAIENIGIYVPERFGIIPVHGINECHTGEGSGVKKIVVVTPPG